LVLFRLYELYEYCRLDGRGYLEICLLRMSSDEEVIEGLSDGSESNYSDVNNNDADDETYSSSSSSDESDGASRTLLFLCEEGILDKALLRVREWDEEYPPGTQPKDEKMSKEESDARSRIRRDILQKNPHNGNYALHEILAGGTSGNSAPELVRRLVYRCCADYPLESKRIFQARPRGSYGRTLLHWCAWSRAQPSILRQVLFAYPEAMCLRDDRAHERRTPLEISQRYWPNDPMTTTLREMRNTYVPYRLRLSVHLCIYRHFITDARTPFDKEDRKATGLTPRAWFVASVIGYALQREMKSLAMHIVSFIGNKAKIDAKTRTRRRSGQSRSKKRKKA